MQSSNKEILLEEILIDKPITWNISLRKTPYSNTEHPELKKNVQQTSFVAHPSKYLNNYSIHF